MEVIRVHHTFKKLSILLRQFSVDIEKSDLFSIGHFGNLPVSLMDDRNDSHAIVPRKNRSDNNGRCGGLLLADAQDRLQTGSDVGGFFVSGRFCSNVIDSGKNDDDALPLADKASA